MLPCCNLLLHAVVRRFWRGVLIVASWIDGGAECCGGSIGGAECCCNVRARRWRDVFIATGIVCRCSHRGSIMARCVLLTPCHCCEDVSMVASCDVAATDVEPTSNNMVTIRELRRTYIHLTKTTVSHISFNAE